LTTLTATDTLNQSNYDGITSKSSRKYGVD